jgi:hypothetical protein
MEVCGQFHASAAFRETIASIKEEIIYPCRESHIGSSILHPTNCTSKMLLSYNFVVYLSNQTAAVWFTAVSDWNTRKVTLCQSSQRVENLRCSKETVLIANSGIWGFPPSLSLSLTQTRTHIHDCSQGCKIRALVWHCQLPPATATYILVFSTA